jgi:hypothetical protein
VSNKKQSEQCVLPVEKLLKCHLLAPFCVTFPIGSCFLQRFQFGDAISYNCKLQLYIEVYKRGLVDTAIAVLEEEGTLGEQAFY